MLKSQDIVLIMKILAKGQQEWAQGSLAQEIGMSASEVNAGIKRSSLSGLLRKKGNKVVPVKKAIEEFLIHGLKYIFPVERGEPTRGIPTSFASPFFKDEFIQDSELPPVWPDANGEVKGYALKPLYKCVPYAVQQDQLLYQYLSIIDALRSGRAREVSAAKKLLQKMLSVK